MNTYALRFPLLLLLTLATWFAASAQISWPEGQIMPSFPRPAQTQDLILLRGEVVENDDEFYLFASLKGIVNHRQPRIFTYEGNDDAEGRYTWLESLKLDYVEHADKWDLMDKYRSEVGGLIVYDPDQLHTVNLATTLAGRHNAIIASPRLLARLTAAPYNFPIVEDLRGRFDSKLEVYQHLYDHYWSTGERRLLMGISPNIIKAFVREYAVALGLPTIWLDPDVGEESDLLNKFLATMPANGHYLGWWPDEGKGITRASQFGIPTIPSDFCTNLTVHSGFDRQINIKPTPPKPELENKIYVAFILSDGDNLQFVEHGVRKLWSHPERGSVPLGWTISPAMRDAMPGALNYYYASATDNDNLISGPSGLGYVYPNFYPNDDRLAAYLRRTEAYNQATGIRVTTVWNTITGGIDDRVGDLYAFYAPSLLGLTAQNTGGPLSIYNNSLPGKPLSCNYCWDFENMSSHIATASEGWTGDEPRFVIIQAQPWRGATPATFKAVADSLGADYRVVRPDHLFQLLREHEGLPIDGGFNQDTDLPLPPGGFTAWRSYNKAGHHIRHASARGRIDRAVVPVEDAYWRMIPGLAGEGVSFQALNFPNNHLRHRGGQLWADGFEDSEGYRADATFYIRPGLADPTLVSFESYNFPGNFIRHRNNELFSEPIAGETARNDATFIPIGRFDDVVSTAADPGIRQPLQLFPNPVSTHLFVQGADVRRQYVLYTVTGSRLRQFTGAQLQQPVSVADLPQGGYILKEIGPGRPLRFVKY